MNALRYAVKVPLVRGYLSKHRTIEAAEKRVRKYTKKYPKSWVPSIVDLTTNLYV